MAKQSRRTTNAALFAFLVLAGASGAASYAVGVPDGAIVVLSHGVFGLGLLLLAPWKSLIVRSGIVHARPGRWASVFLLASVSASILFGVLHSTAVAVELGPVTSMQIHVGAALICMPFAAWHVIARPQKLHRADLNRRNFLKAGALVAGSAAIYGALEGGIRLVGLPGAARRFTGSHRSDPLVTSWLNDKTPLIDTDQWRMSVGSKELTHEELERYEDKLDATLDCTGGWFSHQGWVGVRLNRLLNDGEGDGRSILVTSVTGYKRRFPISDLDSLFIATAMGGRPLDPGHGFPARLVAPGRRGFWWVKWILDIRVENRPAWLQVPFPLS